MGDKRRTRGRSSSVTQSWLIAQCRGETHPQPQPGSPSPPASLPTGRYLENHGVIHNMWFNTSTGQKLPYYYTQGVDSWWDNGSLPIWITAQRQASGSLCTHSDPAQTLPRPSSDPAQTQLRQILLQPGRKSYRQATISSGHELTSSLQTTG